MVVFHWFYFTLCGGIHFIWCSDEHHSDDDYGDQAASVQRPTGSDCAARLGAATSRTSRTSRVSTSAKNAAGRKSQCVIDSEQLNELSLCGDEMNSTTSKAKAKMGVLGPIELR